MRRLALLLALAAACRSTPSRLDQRTASTGSATADPWKPAAGSSLDIPAWAHDSPTVLRDKINAVNAHVVVLKATDMPEYHRVLESTEHTAGVIAAEPFLFVEGTVALGSGAPLPTAVKGIDPARAERVLAIAKHLQTGSLASLGLDDAIVGDDLVHQLGAKLGDRIQITLPADPGDTSGLDDRPAQPARGRTLRIAGTFHVDFDEYDGKLVLATVPAIQALVGRGDQVMGIEAVVKDVDHADVVARELEKNLGGPPYQAMDWYALNKNLFTAMYGDKKP